MVGVSMPAIVTHDYAMKSVRLICVSTAEFMIERLLGIAHRLCVLAFLPTRPLCYASPHFFGINILDVSLNPVDISKWIAHTPNTISKHMCHHFRHGLSTGLQCPFINQI